MSLLQQTIQLLSEAPGSIVYHLVTLLTLQAVFAISRSQWQREPADQTAQRMMWAAGTIFITRVVLLIAGVALNTNGSSSVLLLLPIEQAVHTLTAVLLVWALVPHSRRYPRLGDVLLLISLLLIVVMAIFYFLDWKDVAAQGAIFSDTQQLKIWGIIQMVTLGVGIVFAIAVWKIDQSLNLIILGLLLTAHVANFLINPKQMPSETEISFWIRLGHLVVFPLWTVLVYRRSLSPLLASRYSQPPLAHKIRQSLLMSTQILEASSVEDILQKSIEMVSQMVDAALVGIALFDERDRNFVHLFSSQSQIEQNYPRSWNLNLLDWPAFRLSIEQGQSVQLMPDGLGARQLFNWYEEMGLTAMGALLIQPTTVEDSSMSLLVLAGAQENKQWSEDDKVLASVLADYLAKAIDHSKARFATESEIEDQSRIETAVTIETETMDEAEPPVSGRVIALEEERKTLLSELEKSRIRNQRLEREAVEASKKSRDLAATLEELDRLNKDEQIAGLEAEIAALRESLIEAEEAMALAAASESGLSTDWVMLTITRYSGQLEEAQARIHLLEEELLQWEKGPINQVVASLAQELRMPMTSIAGYTDLLLGERMGILGTVQHDFLRKIKANSERMSALLEHIVQMTTARDQTDRPSQTKEMVNVQEVIETAINTIITQVREKNLRLDLNIWSDLPKLYINRGALSQITTSLLGNACQSSANNGRVAITAFAQSVSAARTNGNSPPVDYLQISFSDSGSGISPEDWARVFEPLHRAEDPLIPGRGDTGIGLSVARTLTEANGGRIWVESEIDVGTTFSTLFPISTPESEGKDSKPLTHAADTDEGSN